MLWPAIPVGSWRSPFYSGYRAETVSSRCPHLHIGVGSWHPSSPEARSGHKTGLMWGLSSGYSALWKRWVKPLLDEGEGDKPCNGCTPTCALRDDPPFECTRKGPACTAMLFGREPRTPDGGVRKKKATWCASPLKGRWTFVSASVVAVVAAILRLPKTNGHTLQSRCGRRMQSSLSPRGEFPLQVGPCNFRSKVALPIALCSG